MKRLILVLAVLVLPLTMACNGKTPTSPGNEPTITTFSADALTVKVGTTITLRWDVTPATADVRIDPFVGNVPVVGSTSLILTGTTTFVLNARASLTGAAAQRVLTIVVTP